MTLNYDEFRSQNSMPPLAPRPKYRRQHNFMLSDEAYEGLKALAPRLGYRFLSEFMEALGNDLLIVSWKTTRDE